MDTTTLLDAVHGDVELTPAEIDVLDTPSMQRLRGIRQLGAAYLVYPAAQHSRFEHSSVPGEHKGGGHSQRTNQAEETPLIDFRFRPSSGIMRSSFCYIQFILCSIR